MPRAEASPLGGAPSEQVSEALRTQFAWIRQGGSWSGRERNCCFLNTHAQRFADASAVSGLDFPDDTRGLSAVDWDHDGDLDLWLTNRTAPQVRMMRNESRGHHHLALRLQGTNCNRDAIGARVSLFVQGEPMARIETLRSGDAYLSQSSKWVHFGLGVQKEIDRVVVQWPGGKAETFVDLKADRHYVLVQGSGRALPWKRGSPAQGIQPSQRKQPEPSVTARVVCSPPVLLPTLSYTDYFGMSHRLAQSHGQTTLLTIWASWCPACAKEIQAFSDRAEELKQAKVEIITACVTDNENDATGDGARQLLDRLKFPFSSGKATPELLDKLQLLHDFLLDSSRPLPVPTSFLLDAQGRLAVIYKGPVEVDSLLDDVNQLHQGATVWRKQAVPLTGRWAAKDETQRSHRFGLVLLGEGYADDARSYYRKLLKEDSDSAMAHYFLGQLLSQEGKFALAEGHYRQCLDIMPDNVNARDSLATTLAGQGRLAEAEAEFRRALKVHPTNFHLLHNLGTTLYFQGNFPQAVEQLKKAVSLRGDNSAAHDNLGLALLAEGLRLEAMVAFEHALQYSPDTPAFRVHLAETLLRQGKFSEAAEQMRAVIKRNPEYPGAQENLRRIETRIKATSP